MGALFCLLVVFLLSQEKFKHATSGRREGGGHDVQVLFYLKPGARSLSTIPDQWGCQATILIREANNLVWRKIQLMKMNNILDKSRIKILVCGQRLVGPVLTIDSADKNHYHVRWSLCLSIQILALIHAINNNTSIPKIVFAVWANKYNGWNRSSAMLGGIALCLFLGIA